MKQWIEKNYTQALELAKPFVVNLRLLNVLAKGANEYNVGKLEAILHQQGFIAPLSVTEDPNNQPTPAPPLITLPPVLDVPVAESTAQFAVKQVVPEIRAEMHPLFNEKQKLQRQLEMPMTQEARGKAALRILGIVKELDVLKAREDYYLEHGRLPDAEATEPTTHSQTKADITSVFSVFKRIATLGKNISRDKSRKPEDVPRWEAELTYLKSLEIYKENMK
jgi:hypothetical protein